MFACIWLRIKCKHVHEESIQICTWIWKRWKNNNVMGNIFICFAKDIQNNFFTSIHCWRLWRFSTEKTFFFTPSYSFMSRFFFSFMFLPGRGVISEKRHILSVFIRNMWYKIKDKSIHSIHDKDMSYSCAGLKSEHYHLSWR